MTTSPTPLEVLRVIIYDLRSPVMLIRGYSELMLDENPVTAERPDQTRAMLETLIQHANRLNELIDTSSDYSYPPDKVTTAGVVAIQDDLGQECQAISAIVQAARRDPDTGYALEGLTMNDFLDLIEKFAGMLTEVIHRLREDLAGSE
ncbi:MAG: hypothetical protein JXQ72_07990 [Anaerolineae bacterium]|nr:hypothetical protein [Anaerolineae bacterium]